MTRVVVFIDYQNVYRRARSLAWTHMLIGRARFIHTPSDVNWQAAGRLVGQRDRHRLAIVQHPRPLAHTLRPREPLNTQRSSLPKDAMAGFARD